MDERIYSIEDILDSSELVFVDTSCDSFLGEHVLWNSFNSRYYFELNRKELRDNLASQSFFRDILIKPNVYTVPEVVGEIFDLSNGLSNKIRFLNSNSNYHDLNKHSRNKKSKILESKDLISKLQRQVWRNYKLAEKSIYPVEDERIGILTDMVKIIDGEIGLKQDASVFYHDRNQYKKSRDTDERLVANLYYHSIFSRDKPVLLTRDTDFIRLFGVAGRMLGSKEFTPLNQEFRDGIVYNPLTVYLCLPKGWVKRIDSSNTHFDDKFKIRFMFYERNETIKNQVSCLWKKFNDSIKVYEKSDEPDYPTINTK